MSMLSPTAALEAAPHVDRPPAASGTAPTCGCIDLGNIEYGAAWDVQRQVAAERKQGVIGDRLLFAEHPQDITMGRVAKEQHLLVSRQQLERAGIALWETHRGGDIT
jgi:lipoate-protein ligase B